MAHTFSDEASTNRKKVVEHLNRNLNEISISLAFNGLYRFGENLVCSKSRGDGTDMHMFSIIVDLLEENQNGPPMLSITQLETIVRRKAFEKSILLPVEKYKMFIVKKNGSINVSEKKTPKIKLIVEEPNPNMVFFPGKIALPEAEKRIVFLFFGDESKAKADMKNNKMGTKPHNDGNVYRMCEAMCSQLCFDFNDSKKLLPEFIVDFSFPSIMVMKSILYLARDQIVEEEIFANFAAGKSNHYLIKF